MSELFDRLTPDRVLEAACAGGFEPTGHCSALHCLENRVYDLKLEDDRHIVAKFYRPGRWSREAILAEHRFLLDLGEAEIPAVAPLAFASGETLHSLEGIMYAVWPRVGGRSPEELSDDELLILGRLLARIHSVGKSRKAPARWNLTADRYAREPLAFLEQGGFLPKSWLPRYRDAVLAAAELYETRARGIPVHRIHGDCHHGNLLRGREGFFFIDFDDFLTGPAVQDVWLLVPSQDAEGQRQRRVLIEGYRQLGDFDDRWLRLVEPLRALRFIHYAAWIARRWKDRAFPVHFPHFGTETYWERETGDLLRQLQFIREQDEAQC